MNDGADVKDWIEMRELRAGKIEAVSGGTILSGAVSQTIKALGEAVTTLARKQ